MFWVGRLHTDDFVDGGVLQGSILGPTLFHQTLVTFLVMLPVVLLSMLISSF